MAGTQLFGYALVTVSAVLLAQHWFHWRDAASRVLTLRQREYLRRQIQRRSVASALIGVVGAAIVAVMLTVVPGATSLGSTNLSGSVCHAPTASLAPLKYTPSRTLFVPVAFQVCVPVFVAVNVYVTICPAVKVTGALFE